MRNRTRNDVRIDNVEIRDMKFIDSLLTIVYQIEWFSRKEMIFSIDVIFEKWKIVTSIQFEIDDVRDHIEINHINIK